MKLAYLEACGFRGFRDKIRVEFGSGFTVISGRNGVGKSTLCDAVEFAITGTIRKFRIEKSGQESLVDYFWWRGTGSPDAQYVTVAFIAENQSEHFTVTRTRESGCDRTTEEIGAALCYDTKPDDALRQLCKTSIIRDEWISTLSVDLSEAQRFEFIQSALGTLEGSELSTKAKSILASAKSAYDRSERTYERAQDQLSTALAEFSDVRQVLTRSGDLKESIELVEKSLADPADKKVDLLRAGRGALLARRSRFAGLRQAVDRSEELVGLREALEAPKEEERRQSARRLVEQAIVAKSAAEDAVAKAEEELAQRGDASTVAALLAVLLDHGERLGLHDGNQCPLCAADRTIKQFEDGLETARARVDSISAGAATARRMVADARTNAERAVSHYAAAIAASEEIAREEKDFKDREQAQIKLLERLDLDSRYALNPRVLEAEASAEHERVVELERAVSSLESSRAVSATVVLQDRIEMLRQDVQEAALAMNRYQEAVSAARTIDRTVKRVNSEIVDERLAQIIPLLDKLYQRLRPHPDWRTMGYRMRGEVKRFLSLRIGDDLNPQFVLSSGQRRAVGLSFLLSVHLARAWARWRTLLLDDPVQHIDDYRALHIVEILSALRIDDRQIVCTVEDEALGDLLCRRLSTTSEQTGRRYVLATSAEGVSKVESEIEILPPPVSVLRSWAEVPAVGLDS